MPFSRYLEVLAEQERGVNLSPNHVPSTFLFAYTATRIIGRVSIRHSLNAFLERVGGHIGYVVVPEFRRRGSPPTLSRLSPPNPPHNPPLRPHLVTPHTDTI